MNRTCSISDGIFQFSVCTFFVILLSNVSLLDVSKFTPISVIKSWNHYLHLILNVVCLEYSQSTPSWLVFLLISYFLFINNGLFNFFLVLLPSLGFGIIDCTCFPVLIQESCRTLWMDGQIIIRNTYCQKN
jgi:hypothetical protein